MFSSFLASATGAQTSQAALEVSALQRQLDAANKAFLATNREAAQEAEARYRTVLVDAENALQPDDPQLLCAKANLGVALRLQGRYEEAEEQFTNTLESCEKVCEARFVCQLRMNIALSLKAQRDGRIEDVDQRFAEADAEAEKLLKAGMLKPDDAMLLTFKQAYADFLLEIGDLAGEQMWLDVVVAKERLFGPDDHRALACKQALSESLALVQVDDQHASNLPVDEAGIRMQVDLHESKRPGNRAAGLLWEVLEAREANDREDPLVIENTQVKLAEMLMDEVDPPELGQAEALLRSALESRIRRLGSEEKSVTDLHWILGACLWREARTAEAAKEFKRCWLMRERILGPRHKETIFAKNYYNRVKGGYPCCSVQ